MTLRRLSIEQEVPLSGMEIIGCVRIGTDEERILVETFLREACSGIELVCQRSVTFAEYELVLSTAPHGTDDNIGPLPFTANHRNSVPGLLSSSFVNNGQFHHLSPPGIELHVVPVQRIASFEYYNLDGELTVWDPAEYQLQQDEPSIIYPAYQSSWPMVQSRRDAIRIRFWAGETDRLYFNADNTAGQFSSASGYPWADGDRFVLRASGLSNSALGDVASVPTGFTDQRAYFVRDVDAEAGTFNLAATATGDAIVGKCVTQPERALDYLYAGQMLGVTSHAIRKETLSAFTNRGCDDCQCSAGSNGVEDYFFQHLHLQKLIWRSAFTH